MSFARLVARLPLTTDGDPSFLPYFELLDRALEDRLVSEDEGAALEACAAKWGLSREMVERAHDAYFSSVARAALADGNISHSERRDLESVSRLLGLAAQRAEDLLAVTSRNGEASATDETAVISPAESNGWSLHGQSVCFTGELRATIGGRPVSRAQAETWAEEHGLIVAKSVTKKLNLLVVADPNTLSGKAQKARQYGTRIMAEAVLWATLGVKVD